MWPGWGGVDLPQVCRYAAARPPKICIRPPLRQPWYCDDMIHKRKLSRLLDVTRSSETGRFLLFLAVGGMNTLVGYGFFVAFHLLGLSPTLSIICATVLGVVFNFLSTGRIVFASQQINPLPRFLGVYVVQCTANVLMLNALIDAGVTILLAEAIVMAVLAVATYFAMKKFVFPRAPAPDPATS